MESGHHQGSLLGIAIDSIHPIIVLFWKVREIWDVSTKPDSRMFVLAQVSVNPLCAFKMSSTRYSTESPQRLNRLQNVKTSKRYEPLEGTNV